METAFVALSGGVDSTTALAIAVENHGYQNVRAVSFNYGQRHARELVAAAEITDYFGVPHQIIELPNIPRSMLTDPSAEIPKVSYNDIIGVSPTYVPFRNGLILATLASLAAPQPNSQDNAHIYFGAHAEDAANDAYPDCRLDFIGTMGSAIYIGSYHRVRVRAPLIEMQKYEIILKGDELQVPYGLTWSCYAGGEKHCGECPTCRARKSAFEEAGVDDPTEYAA